MGDVQEFIDNHLSHYASQYYDPVKAREYYLRTRELKGRKPMSEKQKSAWDYAKGQIKEAEKGEVDAATKARQEAIENSRNRAAMLRAAISQKLKDALEQASRGLKAENVEIAQARAIKLEQIAEERTKRLNQIKEKRTERLEKARKDRADQRRKIAEEATKDMLALPPIPKGISEEQRTKLMFRRSRRVEAIRRATERQNTTVDQKYESARDNAVKESNLARRDVDKWTKGEREAVSKMTDARRENVSEQVRGMKESERATADTGRQEVAQEMKDSIESARSAYQTLKQNIKAKYEAARETEYEAIRTSV